MTLLSNNIRLAVLYTNLSLMPMIILNNILKKDNVGSNVKYETSGISSLDTKVSIQYNFTEFG